jgi:gliding motility-associatede transport system auxiliary component
MAKNKTHKQEFRGQILSGANFAIYTIVVLAIIVLVNWYVQRNDHRWDLTPSHKYSLSEQSMKILKGLNKPVDIYVFDRERAFRDERDLLGNYAAASHYVNVHYEDPDRDPSVARRFNIRSYGTIVVATSDRHFEAQGSTEEGISNALIRVLKGQKVAYFSEGHGERDQASSERSGYNSFEKALEGENFSVKTLTLLQKMEIPSDCAVLVIAGPQNDYLPQEVDTIEKYVKGGGRIMVFVDPGRDLPNLGKMLADWGVNMQNDVVIDENPLAQIFGTQPSMPVVFKYGSSVITQPLERSATLFPLTRSFELGKDSKAGITTDSLCETSEASFGVADWNPSIRTVSAFRAGKDFKGPLAVAVSGDISNAGDKKNDGRFVALGTSAIADNAFLGFQANRDLLMNMLDWLSSAEDLISIRPKPPESQHLDLTTRQMTNLLVFGVLGLPLLIVVTGFLVWWRRR